MPDTQNIPYFRQQGNNCVQAVMKMILASVDINLSLEELDKLTGREKNSETWLCSAFKAFSQLGLEAKYFSLTPYEKFTEDFLKQEHNEELTEALKQAVNFTLNSENFSRKKLSFSELEALSKEYLIMPVINLAVFKNSREFWPHAVLILEINSENVIFHDPSTAPFLQVSRKLFEQAQQDPKTDYDIILVKKIIRE